MRIRFFGSDVPLINPSQGIFSDSHSPIDTVEKKLAHVAFMREPALTFIPRELFLLMEKQYARESQFGPKNHAMLLSHIALIVHEVKINFLYF
jgi:hypothetical protein